MKRLFRTVIKNYLQGFSLIELLISVAILGVAIIAIVGVFPQSINQVETSEQISKMNHLGYAKLDELRAASWTSKDLLEGDHPSTLIETHFSPCPPYCNDAADVEVSSDFSAVPPNFSNYSRAWNVTTSGDGLRKTVRVTVGYLIYKDDGTPRTPSSVTTGPEAVHRRTQDYTTVVTKP